MSSAKSNASRHYSCDLFETRRQLASGFIFGLIQLACEALAFKVRLSIFSAAAAFS